MNKENSKYFILIFALLSLLTLYFSTGLYYTGNERLFSSFSHCEFTEKMNYSNNYNVWFIVSPIITFLSGYCINTYDILIFLVLFYNLALLVFNTLNYFEKLNINVLIVICLLIVVYFINLFTHISNRQIIFLLVFNLIFYCYNTIRLKTKYSRGVVFLLLSLTLIIRFEIAFVVFSICLIISILYNRKLMKYILCFTILSILTLFFYHTLQSTVYDKYYFIEKAEHEIYDRNSVELESSMSKKELLQLKAHTYFIIDKVHLNAEYYRQLFTKKQLITNKLSIKYFKYVQFKLASFYNELFSNTYFLIHFLLSVIILLCLSAQRIKLITIILFILGMPIFFNFFLDFKTDLTIAMYLFLDFSLLLYFFRNHTTFSVQKAVVTLFVCFILVYNLLNAYYTKQYYVNHDEKLITYYRDILTYGKNNHKEIVYSNLVGNFESYPSKLFSVSKRDISPHYYLNLFFYANYSYYINHNQKFFSNIESFEDRVRDIVNKKAVFLSNEEHNKFIVDYMQEVCNYSIKILKEDTLNQQLAPEKGINPYFSIYRIEQIGG